MKRSDRAMARVVDDQIVILDIPSGEYFAMNDVGALVWDLLAIDTTLDDLVDAVSAQYNVEPGMVRADIEALIGDLATAGLVVGDT